MKPENQIDPEHDQKRGKLRYIGAAILIVGLCFTLVGFISFFSGFGRGGFPHFFWCAFVGLPLLWLGAVLCGAGFMGAAARYLVGESAPVAKDGFNYMAEETKGSVKTVAAAVGEGLAAGLGAGKLPQVNCLKCSQPNDAGSKFCKGCGTALPQIKTCPACQAKNEPDAKFCDQCGRVLV